MVHEEWLRNVSSAFPRYFNTLSGKCTIILSDCVIECNKCLLSAQSPVLESYFMSGERDPNVKIEENRTKVEESGVLDDVEVVEDEEEDEDYEHGEEEEEDCDEDKTGCYEGEDEESVLILTEYYGFDDIVKDFFRSFYTGEFSIAVQTYRTTLKLACQYEVSWIITECCEFLKGFLKPHNFIHECRFLFDLKCERITAVALELVETMNFKDMIDLEKISLEWMQLNFEHFTTLLPHLRPSTELHIFHLAFQWLEHEPQRKHKFEAMLSNIGICNLPMKFIGDFLINHAEARYTESANMYKMVLAAQNQWFMRKVGMTKPAKPDFPFPKIFLNRPSCAEFDIEEYEFGIPMECLTDHEIFSDPQVKLSLNPDDDSKFRLRFDSPCCFVCVVGPEVLLAQPIKHLLIPVHNVDGGFVSGEIKMFADELKVYAGNPDVDIDNLSFLAAFLSRKEQA